MKSSIRWLPLTFGTPVKSMREAAQRYGKLFADAEKQTNSQAAAELREFLRNPSSPTVVPETGIINNELFFPTPVTEELWKFQGEVDRRLIELGTPAALVLADREPEPNPRVFVRGKASRLGDRDSTPIPQSALPARIVSHSSMAADDSNWRRPSLTRRIRSPLA